MQNVKFETVEELLDWLPDDELRIVEILRSMVFECIPWAKEKNSFNVPFYSGQKSICFIWPGSVWWGSKKTYDGVQFGFTRGHLLSNANGHFSMGKRKQVITRTYAEMKDIDLEQLRAMLFEAAILDRSN